jgi:putative ABC transport system ATP-binding protein
VPRLEVQDVDVVYRVSTGDVDALVGVSAAFEPGELTAVAGPSGSGKSTLLRVLAALERPATGRVYVGDEDIARATRRRRRALRRRELAYVGSHTRTALVPGSSVEEELRLVAAVRRARAWSAPADERLAAIGLGGRRGDRTVGLSGGEQQRAAVVAAVVGDPPVVLADEPTAALDSATAELLVAELLAIAHRGATVIVASHDPAVIDRADRVVRLDQGRVLR